MTRFTYPLATAAALIGVALGGAAVASAESPSSTVTVQDGGTVSVAALDGASIDTDGTQGRITGPITIARPQIDAGSSAPKDGS